MNLQRKGYRVTGTLRENRANRPPLPSSKDLKKKPRGHFDYRFETENSILIVKWVDNSVVPIGANYNVVEPVDSVKRWSASEKKKVSVSRPRVLGWEGSTYLTMLLIITGLKFVGKDGGGYWSHTC